MLSKDIVLTFHRLRNRLIHLRWWRLQVATNANGMTTLACLILFHINRLRKINMAPLLMRLWIIFVYLNMLQCFCILFLLFHPQLSQITGADWFILAIYIIRQIYFHSVNGMRILVCYFRRLYEAPIFHLRVLAFTRDCRNPGSSGACVSSPLNVC